MAEERHGFVGGHVGCDRAPLGAPHQVVAWLAEFVHEVKSAAVPDSARVAAHRCLLDLLGAAIAGHDTPGAAAARATAAALHAPGPSSVWFGGPQLHPAGAALANSAAACILDLDDGHRAASGHPGAAVIPAVLAVAEETNASADDLLAAAVVGYEVGLRVAAARDVTALGAFSTGRWCGYGVVAGAGWLRRTPPPILAQAFAVSGVSAPNQFAAGTSGYSRLTGNDVKEGIPWATATALSALTLAEAGFTGPADILDHAPHYDAARIVDGLGASFLIERTYFKPYSACRWAHAAIDAVGAIVDAERLAPGDIHAIEVHAFDRALRLANRPDPSTLVDAQYSLPYCVALRAVAGTAALLPMREADLGRADVVALARKVRLSLDPALDAQFPARTPARAIIETAGRRFERLVPAPLGDADHPLSDDALRAKFRALAAGRLPDAHRDRLLGALDALADGRLAPLLAALRVPLPRSEPSPS